MLHLCCAQVQGICLCPATLKYLNAIALFQLLMRANHLLVIDLRQELAILGINILMHVRQISVVFRFF